MNDGFLRSSAYMRNTAGTGRSARRNPACDGVYTVYHHVIMLSGNLTTIHVGYIVLSLSFLL